MIKQVIQIEVELDDNLTDARVSIAIADPAMPDKQLAACIMAATENLMTNFAISSGRPFEDALKLLCEGARTNQVEFYKHLPGGTPS